MANQATYSVSTLCRVLGVSPSGYYAWRNRAPSRRKVADAELTVLIRKIHCSSRRTYGAPRVHAELSDQGFAVSQKRVARLMRSQGLQGVSRRRWIRTTVRQEKAHPSPFICSIILWHPNSASLDRLKSKRAVRLSVSLRIARRIRMATRKMYNHLKPVHKLWLGYR